jgi:hypothetical protein
VVSINGHHGRDLHLATYLIISPPLKIPTDNNRRAMRAITHSQKLIQ